MSNLITPPDLAERVGVPESTLAQWRYRGVGPTYIHVGRHVRYRAEDVDAWLAEHTVSPGGAA